MRRNRKRTPGGEPYDPIEYHCRGYIRNLVEPWTSGEAVTHGIFVNAEAARNFCRLVPSHPRQPRPVVRKLWLRGEKVVYEDVMAR